MGKDYDPEWREDVDQRRLARLDQIDSVIDLLVDLWGPDASRIPEWSAHELTLSQVRLVLLLDARGPTSIGRIAEWLRVGLPAASGIADRMERHGVVERRHRSDDRRVVECLLTEQGRQLAAEIRGIRRNVVRDALAVLTTAELDQFHALLRAVADRPGASTRSTT